MKEKTYPGEWGGEIGGADCQRVTAQCSAVRVDGGEGGEHHHEGEDDLDRQNLPHIQAIVTKRKTQRAHRRVVRDGDAVWGENKQIIWLVYRLLKKNF